MITIRPYTNSDAEAVKALHAAQGLPYDMPDIERPEFLVRAVLDGGNGPEMALLLRKTAETYLIFNPKLSKREVAGRIAIMTRECEPVARRVGLTDVFCAIPPQISEFGDVLLKHGWTQEPWPYFFRKVDL